MTDARVIRYAGTTSFTDTSWTSYDTTYVITDGTVEVSVGSQIAKEGTKGWHPKIVMKALKSAKLKPAELTELRNRLKKLSKMAIAAQEVGQVGMYETLAKEIACIVKEQEAAAIGHGLRIERTTVQKFVNKTRDRVIKFEKLENFPRTIPKRVRDKIADVRSKGVFDEFWVVYVDYSEESKLPTTKDKIKEKDPILFGAFSVNAVYLHYITDWVDKYCDLTMSKLVEALQEDDPEYELSMVPEPTPEYLAQVVEGVERNLAELDSTKASNYLAKMLEQEKTNRKALEKENRGLVKQLKEAGIKAIKAVAPKSRRPK